MTLPHSIDLPSSRSLVLLPSYNSGSQLLKTLQSALAFWQPVWVVIDGSQDTSVQQILEFSQSRTDIRVIILGKNVGKGAAVLEGLRHADAAGFEFALVMDADGQHPPQHIQPFLQLAEQNPGTMILGVPIFGPDAPRIRIYGRILGNFVTHIETLWGGIHDSLFGFRVYPVRASVQVMERISTARRFDFDTELAVRLYWEGLRPINVRVPVKYPSKEEGGVTCFRYIPDNILLIRRHSCLLFEAIPRLPYLLSRTLARFFSIRTQPVSAGSLTTPIKESLHPKISAETKLSPK